MDLVELGHVTGHAPAMDDGRAGPGDEAIDVPDALDGTSHRDRFEPIDLVGIEHGRRTSKHPRLGLTFGLFVGRSINLLVEDDVGPSGPSGR